jgi:hypothetical protein
VKALKYWRPAPSTCQHLISKNYRLLREAYLNFIKLNESFSRLYEKIFKQCPCICCISFFGKDWGPVLNTFHIVKQVEDFSTKKETMYLQVLNSIKQKLYVMIYTKELITFIIITILFILTLTFKTTNYYILVPMYVVFILIGLYDLGLKELDREEKEKQNK